MKIHDASPARAACAATAFARLPVDAQPTVSSPNASAALIAVDTTRSLNDSEGCDTASFFTHTRATPSLSREPRRVDQRREAGVERGHRLAFERQPLAIAPQRLRPRRDRRAIGQPARRGIQRLERTEAVLADRDWCRVVLGAAQLAPLGIWAQRRAGRRLWRGPAS